MNRTYSLLATLGSFLALWWAGAARAASLGLPDALTSGISTAQLVAHDPDGVAAFRTRGRWMTTASGDAGSWGDPATLTWSIVPDGTSIPASYVGQGEQTSPSDLIAFLDAHIGGGGGASDPDLTHHDWFPMVQTAYERWADLSGLNLVYEPFDDGAELSNANSGLLGVRGDMRLGGHLIDGLNPDPNGDPQPNIVAYSYFPSRGDTVMDTGNVALLGSPEGNFLRLRNALTHEVGHGLGLDHVESDLDPVEPGNQLGTFLMEPTISTNFDGPQYDDVLGIHRLYGDHYEKGAGNNVPADAVNLGSLTPGKSVVVGGDGNSTGTQVAPGQVDFASIDSFTDEDFFAVSTSGVGYLKLLLSPVGPTYLEGPEGGAPTPFDATMQGDLSLDLFAADGTTLLASVNLLGLGGSEQVDDLLVESSQQFIIRVSGATLMPQMYSLSASFRAVPEPASWLMASTLLAMAAGGVVSARVVGHGPNAANAARRLG